MQNFPDNLHQLSLGVTETLAMGRSHALLEKRCGELQMKDCSNSEHETSETILSICVNMSKPGLRDRERKKEGKPLITTDLGGLESPLQHEYSTRQEGEVPKEKNRDFRSVALSPVLWLITKGGDRGKAVRPEMLKLTGARRELASDACHQRRSKNNHRRHQPGTGLPSAGVFSGS